MPVICLPAAQTRSGARNRCANRIRSIALRRSAAEPGRREVIASRDSKRLVSHRAIRTVIKLRTPHSERISIRLVLRRNVGQANAVRATRASESRTRARLPQHSCTHPSSHSALRRAAALCFRGETCKNERSVLVVTPKRTRHARVRSVRTSTRSRVRSVTIK